MPKEEWPAMKRRLKERLAGKEENYEYEHVRKDGECHWVSVRALPYRNDMSRRRCAGVNSPTAGEPSITDCTSRWLPSTSPLNSRP